MTEFQCLINKSIKNLRLSKNLTQEAFSELCGLSSDNYRNLEYNRHTPKSSTIDKICNTFNITPIQLLQYGENVSIRAKQIEGLLSNLSDTQLSLVNDFIKMIRGYKI